MSLPLNEPVSVCCIKCNDVMHGIMTYELRQDCWTCSGSPVVEHAPLTRLEYMRRLAAKRRFSYHRPPSGGGGKRVRKAA